MIELARGTVRGQPWGLTFADLARRGHTGSLHLDVDGKRYLIAFADGAVVGASSPLPADAAARIALTSRVITAAQASEIARAVADDPDRDEVEIIAQAAGLSAEEAERLRERVIRQRAARTFAFEEGAFVVTDEVLAPPRCAVDVRSIVYLGARMFASDLRLTEELRQLGSHFTLDMGSAGTIHRFGFSEAEDPVVEALLDGATLAEIEATHRDVDPRAVQAVVYALVTCGACQPSERTVPGGPELAQSSAPMVVAALAAGTERPTGSLVDPSEAPPVEDPPVDDRAADVARLVGRAGTKPQISFVPTPRAPAPAISRTKTPRGPIAAPRRPASSKDASDDAPGED